MSLLIEESIEFYNPFDITSKKLSRCFCYSEAPTESTENENQATNILVLDKTMNNLRTAAASVLQFDKNKFDEVISKAKKINELAQGFADGTKEKSRTIKIHKDVIDIVDGFNKKYGNKVNKSNNYYGDMVVIGLLLMLVETSAILSEAIISMTSGSTKTIDEYVEKQLKYKDVFDKADTAIVKTRKELDKITAELYKEALNVDSLHPITAFYCKENGISLEAEANVSIFRVFKALLFKPLYIILAPIRYIIYMFMLGGFKIADRLAQIQDTINLYDNQSSSMGPSQREAKVKELENRAARARLDRVETDVKVYKKTESDKEEVTKDVNDTNNKASLAAIF